MLRFYPPLHIRSMSERSRRQPCQRASTVQAKSALETLKAAREGGSKRLDSYELKEESAVYDVVEGQAYAELVAARRKEAGQKQGAGGVITHTRGNGPQQGNLKEKTLVRPGSAEGTGGLDDKLASITTCQARPLHPRSPP